MTELRVRVPSILPVFYFLTLERRRLLEEIVGKPIFFFIVFLIQMAISIVNYVLAYLCKKNNQQLAYISNLLAGISWTMTGLYKLGEYFLAL